MATERNFSFKGEKTDKLTERQMKIWQIRFWDGLGCGLSEAEATARADRLAR